MLKGFKEFVMRGNAVDLAVGVVIGAAFGSVVNSLVTDLITPLISAVAKMPDFSKLSITLNDVSLNYGNFLNAAISFLIVAAAIYFIVVVPMQKIMSFRKKDELPNTKACRECLSDIPYQAARCKHCGQPVGE